MGDDRLAKQVFLKEMIIDQGFDGGQFTVYCQGLKGTDIDNYSFGELEDIVRDFQGLVLGERRRKTVGSEAEGVKNRFETNDGGRSKFETNDGGRTKFETNEVGRTKFETYDGGRFSIGSSESLGSRESKVEKIEKVEKIKEDNVRIKGNSGEYTIKAVQVLDNPLSAHEIVTAKLNS